MPLSTALHEALTGILGDRLSTSESQLDLHGRDMAVAGQWRLFWLKFKKHKIALLSLVVILFMYLVAAFADFIAPLDPNATNARFTYAPPQSLSLFRDGSFEPHVNQLKMTLNTESMRREFTPDPAKPLSVFTPCSTTIQAQNASAATAIQEIARVARSPR